MEKECFSKKTVIYKQGTIGNGFYYIEKGNVRVTTIACNGQNLLLEIALPTQIVGIHAMDQLIHFTTAETMSDSILYFFSYDTFKNLIRQQPYVRQLFMQTIIEKMHNLTNRIYLNQLPAEQRLAKLLLGIGYKFENFRVPLTQTDLAKYTGLTRITIYKIIKSWKEKGYIETLEETLLIKNTSELQKFAEGTIVNAYLLKD